MVDQLFVTFRPCHHVNINTGLSAFQYGTQTNHPANLIGTGKVDQPAFFLVAENTGAGFFFFSTKGQAAYRGFSLIFDSFFTAGITAPVGGDKPPFIL